MSNIAGKSYAMNTVSPIKWYMAWINKLIFWITGLPYFASKLNGLQTLSLIHYARWVIVKGNQFPHLDSSQPEEELNYAYEFFFSNFNGSWDQYVDSFCTAIPSGLDLLWFRNVKYPKSVPFTPFQNYIKFNQLWTSHYYNAYPMAAANDVKSARAVKAGLLRLIDETDGASPEKFQREYHLLLIELQDDLSQMAPTPVVSLASQAAKERHRIDTCKDDN